MKRIALMLGAACALVLAGCDQLGMGGGDTRVAGLEKKIVNLEDQNRDVRAKMAAVSPAAPAPTTARSNIHRLMTERRRAGNPCSPAAARN